MTVIVASFLKALLESKTEKKFKNNGHRLYRVVFASLLENVIKWKTRKRHVCAVNDIIAIGKRESST